VSSGVLSLFPGLTLQQITPLPFAVTFDSPLVAGKYEPANLGDLLFHKANPGMLYYIDELSIGCDIDDLNFSAALVDRLSLDILQSNSSVVTASYKLNKATIPIVGPGAIPLQIWYKISAMNSKKGTNINMRIGGQINQTAPLAAKPTVKIFVRGILYQITNTDWIRAQMGG